MNFLAHIYLSGDNELITIGNFMADSIKGKRYKKYPLDIQIGILLHREIDTFTDAHPTVRMSTKRLHENYSHYSGVIVDILYDHFLAKNWSHYSTIPLDIYVDNFYEILKTHAEFLPGRAQKMVPYMIADNWLLSYAKIEGIQKVLNGMNIRTKNISGMDRATDELKEFYQEFEEEFTSFFEELRSFSDEKLATLKQLHGLE
ncbi:acyl carrier protein phosphodiesterase [Gelidibacter pelagius]|uniref:Acyl carrier protein phosphodiesterase n=1 Tax=Gelidibacter pelagius TaxID=2819985 RepID=A0ABS3SU23_9FLAO|nr:acyl carrier protein phosphodiesterase [Gelidibacter pelagius]MBO3098926.1 acyl carrier protein phosphodiesterase [Gelidibacter pelagius]